MILMHSIMDKGAVNMRYKEGDFVTIRNDLKVYATYGGYYVVVQDMLQYVGKTARVLLYNPNLGYYRLCIDNKKWKWSAEMFEVTI